MLEIAIMRRYKINPGIYKITNTNNEKIYIGSTIYLNRRKSAHFRDLEKNKHSSIHLQRAWNKYSGLGFIFEVLESCQDDKKIIIEREQHYLDTMLFAQEFINKLDNRFVELGYNINPIASSPEKRVVSEETRKKMSEKAKGRKHSKESKLKMSKIRIGMKFSEETKQKMRKPKTDSHKANLRESKKNKKQNPSHGINSLIGRKLNIIINNIEYISTNIAGKELGMNKRKVYRRVISDKFPNYYYKYRNNESLKKT